MSDQDNNFYIISLSIVVACLQDNLWILLGEVTCQSLASLYEIILRGNKMHQIIKPWNKAILTVSSESVHVQQISYMYNNIQGKITQF